MAALVVVSSQTGATASDSRARGLRGSLYFSFQEGEKSGVYEHPFTQKTGELLARRRCRDLNCDRDPCYLLCYGNIDAPRNRQEEIATRGAQVMPFDLEQTLHVFQKLDDGGLQKVTVKDPSNKKQIALIRAHLEGESEKFRRGDFSDPAKIHGQEMPGLAELKSAAGKIEIVYTPLPDGAQIRYTTKDPALVMAIHQWFDAQLSDHERHASGH